MNEQEFMQFIEEFPEVIPYLEADEEMLAEVVLNPTYREGIKQQVYVMRGEEPPMPQQPAPQNPYVARDPNANYHQGYEAYKDTGSGYVQGMFGGLPSEIQRDDKYWNQYSNFNAIEKQHQAEGISNKSGITNPFHYANTGDPFGRDAQKWLKANGYNLNNNNGNGLSKEDGTGYAYVDKYGGTHVTYDLITALTYSKDGKVYDYNKSNFGNGYALNGKETESDYGMIYLAGLEGGKPFETWNPALDTVDDTVYKPFSINNLPKGNQYSNQGGRDSGGAGTYPDQRNAQGQYPYGNQLQGNQQANNSPMNTPNQNSAPKPQTYQYENFDASGKSMGFTTGVSGKSNYMQGAVSVKAPNGKIYNTGYQPPANNPATNQANKQANPIKSQPALNFKADFTNFKNGVRDIVYGKNVGYKADRPNAGIAKFKSEGVVNKPTGSSGGKQALYSIKDKLLESLRRGK